MDYFSKLEALLDAQYKDYVVAYKLSFWEGKSPAISGDFPVSDETLPTPKIFAGWLGNFLKCSWKIDFIPYQLDNIDDEEEKGKVFLRSILAAYSDEIEDVQSEIGTSLRKSIRFLKAFAPGLDFLNEIGPDSYLRRPLDRMWQMKPVTIFGDMSVSINSEADTLLDALEMSFMPVVPEIASIADNIRREWFHRVRAEDERDEMAFYETLERAITHIVATESRIAQADWIFRNLDSGALIVGTLDICRKGLECLGMFCSNYKFILGNRYFLENLVGVEG